MHSYDDNRIMFPINIKNENKVGKGKNSHEHNEAGKSWNLYFISNMKEDAWFIFRESTINNYYSQEKIQEAKSI